MRCPEPGCEYRKLWLPRTSRPTCPIHHSACIEVHQRLWVDRPKIRGEDLGAPFGCPNPACGNYRKLKLPGEKLPACPNCGGPLVPIPRKSPVA